MDYLHGEGLLYCDMKPDNVIHGGKRIKVIDLGGARAVDDEKSAAVGTDRYQISRGERDERGLTVRSDIYTVGGTLRDLLGVVPADTDGGDISFGIDSLRRVLERAVAPFNRRF